MSGAGRRCRIPACPASLVEDFRACAFDGSFLLLILPLQRARSSVGWYRLRRGTNSTLTRHAPLPHSLTHPLVFCLSSPSVLFSLSAALPRTARPLTPAVVVAVHTRTTRNPSTPSAVAPRRTVDSLAARVAVLGHLTPLEAAGQGASVSIPRSASAMPRRRAPPPAASNRGGQRGGAATQATARPLPVAAPAGVSKQPSAIKSTRQPRTATAPGVAVAATTLCKSEPSPAPPPLAPPSSVAKQPGAAIKPEHPPPLLPPAARTRVSKRLATAAKAEACTAECIPPPSNANEAVTVTKSERRPPLTPTTVPARVSKRLAAAALIPVCSTECIPPPPSTELLIAVTKSEPRPSLIPTTVPARVSKRLVAAAQMPACSSECILPTPRTKPPAAVPSTGCQPSVVVAAAKTIPPSVLPSPVRQPRVAPTGRAGKSRARAHRAPPRVPRPVRTAGGSAVSPGPVSGFVSARQRSLRLAAAVVHLRHAAPQVARLLTAPGAFAPPFRRAPLFDALARSILYQQVNGATARFLYARLGALLYPDAAAADVDALDFPPLTPKGVLGLGVDGVRAMGVSASKARFIVSAAAACAAKSGGLDERRLGLLDDAQVESVLRALPGVGAWTVAMVSMFVLERPDALPAGDLTLRRAAAALWGVAAPGTAGAASTIGGAVKVSADGTGGAKVSARIKAKASRVAAAAGTEGVPEAPPPALPAMVAAEDMGRLFEACRPFRSYAAWALWGVTDERAFLPIGGVLQRMGD